MIPRDQPYRVLVVDDDEDHVILMKVVFSHHAPDARLFRSRNAEEAIAYLGEARADPEGADQPLPDVIVLDINMPGMGGLGFLEWRRRQKDVAAIPVVVFTSAGDPELAERCFALGAQDFKEKPGDFSELVPVVQRALGRLGPLSRETRSG